MSGVVLFGDGEFRRPRVVIVTVGGSGFHDLEPAEVGLCVVDKSFLPVGIILVDTPHCVCAVCKANGPIIGADLITVEIGIPFVKRKLQ